LETVALLNPHFAAISQIRTMAGASFQRNRFRGIIVTTFKMTVKGKCKGLLFCENRFS
jgi:hypothetical protein